MLLRFDTWKPLGKRSEVANVAGKTYGGWMQYLAAQFYIKIIDTFSDKVDLCSYAGELVGFYFVEYFFDLIEALSIQDGKGGRFDARIFQCGKFFLHRLRRDRVTLCEKHIFRFFCELRTVGHKFFADDRMVLYGIVGFGGHQMEQDFRALDVFQKFYAKPFPARGAFDDAGDVRNNELVVRTEMRLERRKGVIGDAALCRSEFVQKRRLARIGQSDQSDIGDKPQLQCVEYGIPRQPFLKFLGRSVHRGAEFKIPLAARASARGENPLPHLLHFLCIARVLDDRRPDGDFEYEVFTRAPVEELAATVLTVLGLHFFLTREEHERIDIRNSFKIHVGAPPTVPACRSP